MKEGADPSLHEMKEKELKDLKKKQRLNRKKKFLTQEYEQKYKKIKFFGKGEYCDLVAKRWV